MKVGNISVFNGSNIYSLNPIIRVELDIEDLYNKTTKDIDGFVDTFINYFPTLSEHYCGVGYKGGFLDRLREGTYFGHVVEHLTLELQSILGYKVNYGKTRIKMEPSIYNVFFEFANEIVALNCFRKSMDIVEKIIKKEDVDVADILSYLNEIKDIYDLGPSTMAIFKEAKKRMIPVKRLGNDSILQLGYGKYSRLVQASMVDSTSCISADISCNKQLTKQILEENNIPVPYGYTAYTKDEAILIAKEIGFPVVLKPLNGNQGKGVVLNIYSEDEINETFEIAQEHSSAVIVEKCISGNDYRVLVIGDKVSAVSKRTPPFVVGDGSHTIKQLVQIENKNGLRGESHEKPLTKIKLDNITLNFLKKSGLDEKVVPEKYRVIKLRDNGNLSTGGTALECTNQIHPDNAKIAIKAAKAIGLDIAGVDIKIDNISKSIYQSNGAVIEVNAAPGLRMHLQPAKGKKINVASDILDMVFPEGVLHSIPIIALTGTNGKTTTARLINHVIKLTGKTVGMTSTSGVYVGDECVLKGDNTGPFSAKIVLSNKQVDAAVLEVARGGILKRGLGYELADVGLITNISDDHIGLDGVNSIEDLAFVKSLVVETVKPNGHSVLNADDSMIEYFLKRAQGNIILFSKSDINPHINKHIKNGGKALYIKDNNIIIHEGSRQTWLMDIREIPITFNGNLECNIENCLSAACCLYAIKVPLNYIIDGLLSFKPDINMNPGRFNMFNVGNFKVMLDYGHNIGGYQEVGKFAKNLGKRIIGVIGVPGDRTDESIIQVGTLCADIFSKVYIKEDSDLRGRTPGEVANLLKNGLMKRNYSTDNIKIIPSETKALETAMHDSQEGDLIILFYEELDPAVKLIEQTQTNLNKDDAINPGIISPEQLAKLDINVITQSEPVELFNET